ncbi:MAG TPA: Hpt domain-containing protein, partial [Gammaproteobacteria bacterium]
AADAGPAALAAEEPAAAAAAEELELAPPPEEPEAGIEVAATPEETLTWDGDEPVEVELEAPSGVEPEAPVAAEAPVEVVAEPPGVAAAAEAESADAWQPDVPVLSEEFDPETLEIFLEEADEVVGELAERAPRWRASPGDTELVAEIRRAFHTLKGSGRLVGALLMGEFAWSFESLLNRVIDGTRQAGAELTGLVCQAVELLPALVEQLRGGPSPGARVGLLMRQAEALGAGQAATPAAAPPAAPERPPAAPAAPAMNPVLYGIYRSECDGHLAVVRDAVASARQGTEPLPVPSEALLRALHTLRGSSSMAEAKPIARVAGALEERFKPLRAAGAALAASDLDLLDEAAELVAACLDALATGGAPLPEVDAWLERAHAAPAAAAAPSEELAAGRAPEAVPTDSLLHAGADLLDALEDAVSRWVSVSADIAPLAGLLPAVSEVQTLAEECAATPLAELVAALGGLLKALVERQHAAGPEVLSALDQATEDLTRMFDNLAVLRPIAPAGELLEQLAALARSSAVEQAPEPPAAPAAPAPATPPSAAWQPSAEVDPELLQIFLDEGAELLDQAEATVHRWQEEVGDREAIALLQRQLHTLKGGARMAGVTPMGDLSHAAESLLTGVVDGRLEPDTALFTTLNRAVDRLAGMLEAVQQQQPLLAADELLEDLHDLASGGAPRPQAAPAASWSLPAEIDADLLEIFLDEGAELLDQAEATVHRWQEEVSDREAIALLQRQLHTLKGGSRMAGVTPMGDLSHAAESLLTGVVEGRLEPEPALFTTLNRAVDRLVTMLEAVRARQPLAPATDLQEALVALGEGRAPAAVSEEFTPPPPVVQEKSWEPARPATEGEAPQPAAPVHAPAQQQEQIRVRADLLNRLVNLAGEVSIYRARLEQQNSVLRFNLGELDQTATRLREQLRKLEIEAEGQILSRLEAEGRTVDDFDPLEMDR